MVHPRRVLLPALVCATLVGCSTTAPRPVETPSTPMPAAPMVPADPTAVDIHSYARPAEARVTDVALDLTADFGRKQLSGTATLTLQTAPGAREVVLDTRNLAVEAVTDGAGQPLRFTLGAADSILGQSLTVALPPAGQPVVVRYHTTPGAEAVQWLEPAQTAGKQQPFLFTQGEAILTRTWVPTQDSPGIRQTYSARITVPTPLKAVMSAEMLTPDGEAAGAGMRRFSFKMPQAVAPYLIALAVGDLAFRSLGSRTGVYAEPATIAAAASELVDTEKMVAAAESLYGPYRWGRYDVLVLPPSFPFGGMENPRLTFATPTILAGDRSLVSLIAHELAHSWSGNLVTNGTWRDFWLNEGFTDYFERRIMESLYGKDYADMLSVLGYQNLQSTLDEDGRTSPETTLHIDLAGRNPDDGMTDIAYEKGAIFLKTIEMAVGRERFDPFLRGYFDRHAFTSMTSARFLADLRANLIQGDAALEQRLQLDKWVYGVGLPDNVVVPASSRFKAVEAQTAAFVSGTPAARLTTAAWTTQEWLHFLRGLPPTMTVAQLRDLDTSFGLSKSGNSEKLFEWLRIAIRTHYEPAMPALERFVTSQGRRKFIKPLFADLMGTDWGKPLARRLYATARPTYHSVTVNTLDGIVK